MTTSHNHVAARFAAVDWGTSSFRLWLLGASGQVLAERRSDEGMIRCAEVNGFQAVLDAHLAALSVSPSLPVLCCGMVGARQGWIEAPYADTGTPLSGLSGQAVQAPHPARKVMILPGIAQRRGGPPDIMRGEETLIFGIMDGTAAVVAQPGTHSKWIETDGHTITRFSTQLTGELFSLISSKSTLGPLISPDAELVPDTPAYLAALDRALADPAMVLEELFALRAGGVLGLTSPEAARATLSALLIGAEIALVRRRYHKTHVRLLASGTAAKLYGAALSRAGIAFTLDDAESATRRGLFLAARNLGWTE